MLTAEEKRDVEERVAATIREEQRLRELRDYENKLLKEKRDKIEEERNKGDVVFGSKVATAISGLIFMVFSYLIFKTWAIDLDFREINSSFGYVGFSFAILAFRSLYIWLPYIDNRTGFRVTGRRRGARLLASAMLVETILFALLAGYMHCPHDFAHTRYNAGDPNYHDWRYRIEHEKFDPKPVNLCREVDRDTWVKDGPGYFNPCSMYYSEKETMTIMVSIGLAISVISLLVSSRLKDEAQG